MPLPKVAVLIVAYNSSRFIAKTIQSCLDQTYQNLEVVILDNASTDNTLEITRSFNDPKIKIFTSPTNLGPYKGLNFLLDKVDDPYIAIQDHDDLWLPGKIEKQVNFLESHRDYVACGTQVYYFHEARQLLILMDNYKINGYVDHTSLIYRNHGFRYDTSQSLPDEYIQAKILKDRGSIGCLPEGLTIHRIRGDQNNLSAARSRWNFKGAREHLINTKYKDWLGTLSMMISTALPQSIIWWSRKHLTQKKHVWMTQQEFESRYNIQL